MLASYPRLRALALLGALGVISPAVLMSQGAPPVRSRAEQQAADADCRAAEADLLQDTSLTRVMRGLGALRACPELAPALLAARWRRPPADSAILDGLVVNTMRLPPDDRVFAAALGVAADRGASRLQRLAALKVLTAFARDTGGWPVFGSVSRLTFYNNGVLVGWETLRSGKPGPGPQPVKDAQGRLVAVLKVLYEARGEEEYLHLLYWTLLDMFKARPAVTIPPSP